MNEAEKQTIVTRSKADPVWWCETVLGVKLWDKQKQIIEAVRDNKRVTVRSNFGSGKSFVSSCTALWFLANHYPATVITTAPTFRQVEGILWREIAARYAGARFPLGGKLTATGLDLGDNWFAIGLSTDQPERFQGFHNLNVLVVGDEASGLPDTVTAAIENPLSAGNAKLLYIGNPTQTTGAFYNSFQSDQYHPIKISAFDTPNFTAFGIQPDDIKQGTWRDKIGGKPLPFPALVAPEWVAGRYAEWGEGSYLYQVEVLGEFPAAGVNNLFNLTDIESAINRDIKPEGAKVAALDVSRYGDDESVYLLRQGNRVLRIESWAHQDTQYTAGRSANLCRTEKPETLRVDDIGVGGGVADALIKEGIRVDRVNIGVPALDTEHFINKRAEQYWLLSRRFAEKNISIPDNRKLVGQLTDVRYTYNQKGQLIIESKEDMKKRGSKSPDVADALMMAFIPYTNTGNVITQKRFGSYGRP